MNIIAYSQNCTNQDLFTLIKSDKKESVRNAIDSKVIVEKWIKYATADGSESLAFLTKDGIMYGTNSKVFISSFDLLIEFKMPLEFIVISKKSKNGNNYLDLSV